MKATEKRISANARIKLKIAEAKLDVL